MRSTPEKGTTAGGTPLEAVAAWLFAAGPRDRQRRMLLALLASGWHSLAELVRQPALPQRTVEELLHAADGDLRSDGDRYRIAPERAAQYRARFDLPEDTGSRATTAASIVDDEGGAADEATLDELSALAARAPSKAALDHVSATPRTALHRARWLREHYDLPRARLLLLGDHDLTSIATCLLAPEAAVTVVDLDEDVLEHVDAAARERDLDVRCLHADLRFGVPPSVESWADLVFTDPPYTPEGTGLFAARATACLRDDVEGRILLAYGYSERQPALGLKVQRELSGLGLVFEAILPGFHRYDGAQAIGSASDLYVCQPTTRAHQLSRRGDQVRPGQGLYTHGPDSVESGPAGAEERVTAHLTELAESGGLHAESPRGPGWRKPLTVPAGNCAVFDLRGDPDPWLARTLLGCNADRIVTLVDNRHADITNERAQRALTRLVGAKYRLRFRRSEPDSRYAVVVAEASEPTGDDPGAFLVAHLLRRAHGKLGNTWREGLIAAATRSGGTLSKRGARALVTERAPRAWELDQRLIDLPRHRVIEVLDAVAGSAADA